MAQQPKTLSGGGPHSLAEVVELAFTRTGATSSRRLQEYASRHSYELTHSTINLIRKGVYPSRPKDKTIEALAFLSGVHMDTVRKLADLPPMANVPFAEQLPPDVDELEARPRAALLELARLMLDLQRRQGDVTQRGQWSASLEDLGLSGEQFNTEISQEGRPSGG
jgi:hypothetical protein